MAKWNVGARTPLSPREKLINRYRNARSTLLGVMLFSAINVVMAALGSETYFLFSATKTKAMTAKPIISQPGRKSISPSSK